MKYASIDIETLGLNPETCDVIEFGCVLDDLNERKPLDELPQFHAYITQPNNLYKGEPYAMAMHSVILKRIANKEKGYQYIPSETLKYRFIEWLESHNQLITIIAAGKNFQSFDMRFLRLLDFDGDLIHHRTLDPGSMWFDPKIDKFLPNLQTCLTRTGVKKTVKHTAIDDAISVIQCIRGKYL